MKLRFWTLERKTILSIPLICLPKSLALPLVLFNYLMVKKAIVTHIGTIQVTSSLALENVLYVPSFTFNLITASKLTKTMSCCFVFLSTFCFIQDLTCWKKIGVGKLHNDLYLLQESTNCKSILDVSHIFQSVFTSLVNSIAVSTTPVVSKLYLRHLRLGHGSDNKFSALQSVIPDVTSFHSNKDCLVCPIAKQKRLPFPFLNHMCSHAFDLIHCDVGDHLSNLHKKGLDSFLL